MTQEGLHARIAGAIYDLLGELTAGETLRLGSRHPVGELLYRLNLWAEQRELLLNGALVDSWNQPHKECGVCATEGLLRDEDDS